jgi:uncharacterized glyoxalase superfamily protein PhnB
LPSPTWSGPSASTATASAFRKRRPPGIAFFGLRGLRLALYDRESLAEDAAVSPEGSGFSGITLAHNVSTGEEVDLLLGRAVAAGATLVKPAQRASWGSYSGYFADPDGHLWGAACNQEML